MKKKVSLLFACFFSSFLSAQVNIYHDVQALNTLLKKNLNANPSIEFDTKKKMVYYSNDWNRLEIPIQRVKMIKYNDSIISFKSTDGDKWVYSYTKQRRFLRTSADYTITVKKTDDPGSLNQMIALFSSIQRAVIAGNAIYENPDNSNKEKIIITSTNYRQQLDWFEKEAIRQDPGISLVRIGKLGNEGDKKLYLRIDKNTGYTSMMDVTKFTTHLTNAYISIDCIDDEICVAAIKLGTTKIDYDLSTAFTHIKHIGNLEQREKFFNTFVALIKYARENVK